jgi:hypothetical protein
LHLSILIETMRREGYELAISRPEVILHETAEGLEEPYEQLVVDLESAYQGAIMERLGERRGELRNMQLDGKGRVRLDYLIPARGLIGFQSEFRTLTAGTGLMFHVFDHYGPWVPGDISRRNNGVLISNGTGKALANALFNLQERGRMIIEPGVDIYEGQIGDPQPRQRPDRESPEGQATHQQTDSVEGRGPAVDLAPENVAGAGARVHRGRRTGRSDAQGDPHPQDPPAGAGTQAGRAAESRGLRASPDTVPVRGTG